jgi:hypothetical protein
MKNFTRSATISALLAVISSPASAQFLSNWQLDLTGTGASKTTVAEYLDFVGNSFIQTTANAGDPAGTFFTFTDQGVFNVTSVDGGAAISTLFPGYEMTAVFSDGGGTGTLGGGISFNAGTLSIYSDNTPNYAVSDGVGGTIFGADDGTLIGTFDLIFGTGVVDASGIPNGQLTMAFQATSLAAGYWFDSLGNDLSTNPLLFGFVTTNASRVENATGAVSAEIICQQNGFNCPTGTPFDLPPSAFLVSNNGQYRLQIPEPGSIALLGLGLLGLAVRRMRCAQHSL